MYVVLCSTQGLNPLSAGWSVRTINMSTTITLPMVLIPYQQDGP